ncbi:MAG: hypothetical protein AB1546_06885 [bacterium]
MLKSLRKTQKFKQILTQITDADTVRTFSRISLDVVQLLLKHPDLLLLPEVLKASSESNGLKRQTGFIAFTDKNKILVTILTAHDNGRIKSLKISEPSEEIMKMFRKLKNISTEEFHFMLEEKMGRLRTVSVIEINALKNILHAGNVRKDKVFNTYLTLIDELKKGRIILSPMNPYLDLMLEVDSEDLALKFILPLDFP